MITNFIHYEVCLKHCARAGKREYCERCEVADGTLTNFVDVHNHNPSLDAPPHSQTVKKE